MATIRDLFKEQNKELYGLTGKAIIESRGFINPPRGAALLASSPNTLADLIGNQVSGVLKGSANRPSDTIFKNDKVISKPITLGKTQQGIRNAIDVDGVYYVKQSPSPDSILGNILQGGSTIGGTLANAAIKAVTKGGIKNIKEQLKKSKQESYGVAFGHDSNGKTIYETKKFSQPNKSGVAYYKDKDGKLAERKTGLGANGNSWDSAMRNILEKEKIEERELKNAEKNGHVVVTFGRIIDDTGTVDFKVPFIGAVTGISEDIAPEWTNFRYIGSPFKINRYSGVERTIKFNLKLYYTTSTEKTIMLKKINYLKSLAFPDSNIKTIEFGPDAQYAFAPNIVKFGIGSLYKNVAGFIESLSFSIEDNTPWPKMGYGKTFEEKDKMISDRNDFDADNVDENFMYPSVVDVSISIKIIESHKIDTGTEKTTKIYRYDFDGLNDKQQYSIEQSQAQNTKSNKTTVVAPAIVAPASLPNILRS